MSLLVLHSLLYRHYRKSAALVNLLKPDFRLGSSTSYPYEFARSRHHGNSRRVPQAGFAMDCHGNFRRELP